VSQKTVPLHSIITLANDGQFSKFFQQSFTVVFCMKFATKLTITFSTTP